MVVGGVGTKDGNVSLFETGRKEGCSGFPQQYSEKCHCDIHDFPHLGLENKKKMQNKSTTQQSRNPLSFISHASWVT